MIGAVIMASGYSKRMKENKLLLPYKGKYMIEHTLDTVCSIEGLEIILVARDQKVIKLGQDRGIKTIKNHYAKEGISASIRLGVKMSQSKNGYMFFTGDQPLLKVDTVKHIMKTFKENPKYITIPMCQGKKGNPVIFPYGYRLDLLSLQGDVGGKQIISDHLDQVQYVSINDPSELMDTDTVKDYKELLNRRGRTL